MIDARMDVPSVAVDDRNRNESIGILYALAAPDRGGYVRQRAFASALAPVTPALL
ncbi:hypothetical protein [Sphingomonas aquatica]|uniref:hypothetical protein n=1 Tax=Sphingomonas aquatica TaxID=1763824 RepID=UPI001454C9F4